MEKTLAVNNNDGDALSFSNVEGSVVSHATREVGFPHPLWPPGHGGQLPLPR
jgi:hypothetical protein